MNKLKSIIFALFLLLAPGCQTFQTLAPLAVTITIKEKLEKKPSDGQKVLRLADEIDALVATKPDSLTLNDFTKLSAKVGLDSTWAIVIHTIYDNYKQFVSISPEDQQNVIFLVKKMTDAMRNGVGLVDVQK